MRRSLLAVSLCFGGLFAACGDGGGTPGTTSADAPVPNVAGRYAYESLATMMRCSGGLDVPLPAVSDTLTITQSGNRIDGELAIASTVSAPTGATFFDDCLLSSGGAYSCSGEYRDASSVIAYSGGGQFTTSGFSGTVNLRMTLADGTVCTWTKQERGPKIS